jgi:phosphate transport system protein
MPEQRKSFHTELDDIRDEIVRLAAMLGEFIPRGTEALLTNDMQGAQSLIEDDDEIDALTLRIEEQCYHVLALQQPMASDLRSIVTALWLTAEIERSADLMVNVAKGARRIYGASLDARLRGLIERMAEEAARLYKLAIDAYVERNAGLGSALDDIDDTLDALHNDYIEAIFECHAGQAIDLQQAVQLALIGRYYERIGDHAVNIGERVEYMVTGWLPEHSGAARAKVRSAMNEPDDAVTPSAVLRSLRGPAGEGTG